MNIPEPIIRYCGGCNPRYDRVKTAARMKEAIMEAAAGDLPSPLPETPLTLVICGCQTACVWRRSDKENPNAYKITSEKEAENVITKLTGREEKAGWQGEK